MTDLLSALREFRTLEDRRVGASLSEIELARWGELRGLLGNHARLLAPPPGVPAAPEAAATVPTAVVPPLVDAGDVEDVPIPGPSPEPAEPLSLASVAAPPPDVAPPAPVPPAESPEPLALAPITEPLADVPPPAPVPPAASPEPLALAPITEPLADVPPPASVPPAESPEPLALGSVAAPPPDVASPAPVPPATSPEPLALAPITEPLADVPPPAPVPPAASPEPLALAPITEPLADVPPPASVPPAESPEPLALAPVAEPLPDVPPPAAPAPSPEPISAHPSLPALESKATDAGAEGLAEAAEPAQREQTQPGFSISELSPPSGVVPESTAEMDLAELETQQRESAPTKAPALPLDQQLEALAWGAAPPLAPSFEPVAAPPAAALPVGSPVAPLAPQAPAFPAPMSMRAVTLKGPVPPLVLGSPIAPAMPGDFDAPVTPIVFGEPIAAGAPIAVAPVDAEAIVESVWRDTGDAGEQAPPASAASSGLGPLVAPIPLGSPIAPEIEAEAEGQGGGIPLETVPYPSIRARLKPVKPPEDTSELPVTRPQRMSEPPLTPLQLVPTPGPAPILLGPSPEQGPLQLNPAPEPATPDWLPAEPLFETRPEPPTGMLDWEVEPKPETPLAAEAPSISDDLPALEQSIPKEQLFETQSTGWLSEQTDERAVLQTGVRDEGLPPEPARGLVPGEHRVVVHTVAGPLKRGTLRDPDLDSGRVDLVLPNGSVEGLGAELIKAIFFMRAPGEQPPRLEGKWITVSFKDGRQLSGYCAEVHGNAPGFFLLPADSRSNTARIYVFRSAVKDIAEG